MAFRFVDPNPAVCIQDGKLRVIFSVPLHPSASVPLLPSTLSRVLPDIVKTLGLSKLNEQNDASQPKQIFRMQRTLQAIGWHSGSGWFTVCPPRLPQDWQGLGKQQRPVVFFGATLPTSFGWQPLNPASVSVLH